MRAHMRSDSYTDRHTTRDQHSDRGNDGTPAVKTCAERPARLTAGAGRRVSYFFREASDGWNYSDVAIGVSRRLDRLM